MLPTLHGIDVRKTVMGRLAAGEPPSSTACEERSVPATQAVDSVQLVAEAGVQHHGNSEQDGKETKAKGNDSGNSRGKGKSQPKKIGPRLQTPAKVLKRPAGASQMTPKKKPAAAPAKARPAADVSLEVPVTPEVTPEVHVQAHGSDGAEEDDASTVASDATTMDMGEYYQKQLAKAEARKEAAAMEETKKKPAAQDDAEPCTESTPTKTKAHEDTQSKSPKPKSSKSLKSKSSKSPKSKSSKAAKVKIPKTSNAAAPEEPKARGRQAKNAVCKTIKKADGWIVEYRKKATDGTVYFKIMSPTGASFPSTKKAMEHGYNPHGPEMESSEL